MQNDTLNMLEKVDWQEVSGHMNTKGYAVIERVVSPTACDTLIDNYYDDNSYRKTIKMERYQFGKGEYKYFTYPLPNIVNEIREHVYPKLSPIANSWMKALRRNERFPDDLTGLLDLCHDHKQLKPTPLILKYEKGGYNTLHQDLYGDIFFPIQLVVFLSEPGDDYEGGEFVMTEQRPRAQSKAMVLRPRKGDILIFTTNFRPVPGSRGYYQVKMKHGVSEIQSGTRHTLGIIFHDAL